jgi:hypothetical protein
LRALGRNEFGDIAPGADQGRYGLCQPLGLDRTACVQGSGGVIQHGGQCRGLIRFQSRCSLLACHLDRA